MRILWVTILTAVLVQEVSLAPSLAASSKGQTYKHNPKDCGCNSEEDYVNVWLDIIFILDTSAEVPSYVIANYKSFLMTIARYYAVGESKSMIPGKYTRVAIITNSDKAVRFANLTTYKNGAEMVKDVRMIDCTGGQFDPQLGIAEAQNMIDEERAARRRLNVQKVVVLYSSASIDCSESEMASAAEEGKVSKRYGLLCNYMAKMASEGTTVMTVALNRASMAGYPVINAGDKCYRFVDDVNVIENLMRAFCAANCYCPEPYVQFKDEEQCTKYGECFLPNSMPFSYDQAQEVCEDLGGLIPAIENEEKKKFLQDIHTEVGKFPFWIGIQHFSDGNFYYNTGEKISLTADFFDWCDNEPDLSKGDCVYMRVCKGFKTGWSMEKCGKITPEHFFSCQRDACTANNFCG